MPEVRTDSSRRLLPEDMLLLLAVCGVAWPRQRPLVGAAGVIELLLSRRVRIEGYSGFGLRLKRLTVLDTTSTGDEALDSVLSELTNLPPRRRLLYHRVPKFGDYFLTVYGERLVAEGALTRAEAETIRRNRRIYIVRDASAAAVGARVRAALVGSGTPDTRTSVLAALVQAANLTQYVVGAKHLTAAPVAGTPLGVADTAAVIAAHESKGLGETAREVTGLLQDLLDTQGDFGDGNGGDNGGDGSSG